MGNCCIRRGDKTSLKNECVANKEVNGINIRVVLGDIWREESDCLVNWSDCFMLGEKTLVLGEAMSDQLRGEIEEQRKQKQLLRVGECFMTSAGKLKNTKFIIHATIPLWRGGDMKELEKFEKATTACLQLAADQKMGSIAFTQESSDSFGIPLQNCAQVLLRTFQKFSSQKQLAIQQITFVHSEKIATNLFKKQLTFLNEEETFPEPEDQKSDQQSVYSDRLQSFYFSRRNTGFIMTSLLLQLVIFNVAIHVLL